MVPIHLFHVHIRMLHGMFLPRRRVIFFFQPLLVYSYPVFRVHLLEGGDEGFLVSAGADSGEHSRDLVFLSTYEATHTVTTTCSSATVTIQCICSNRSVIPKAYGAVALSPPKHMQQSVCQPSFICSRRTDTLYTYPAIALSSLMYMQPSA